jgi:hypothetical protein
VEQQVNENRAARCLTKHLPLQFVAGTSHHGVHVQVLGYIQSRRQAAQRITIAARVPGRLNGHDVSAPGEFTLGC